MGHESEVKFRVRGFPLLRQRLEKAGAELLHGVLTTDIYYDTPQATLRNEDRGMRIRSFKVLKAGSDGDMRPELTYKGPREPHDKIKIRKEIQTRVDDAQAAGQILRALGVAPSMKIQKRRESYRLHDCRIELDELPFLGLFVEVEGPDERAIQRVCEKMKLHGTPVMQSYTRLASAYCEKRGLDARKITFTQADKNP